MNKYVQLLIAGIIIGVFPEQVFAASENQIVSQLLDLALRNVFVIMSIMVILVLGFTLAKLTASMLEVQKLRLMKEMGLEPEKKPISGEQPSIFQKSYQWLWSIVPVSREKEIDLGHDYDGIRELDNRLPPWWLLLFYGTILFSVIYMFYYHWAGRGWSSEDQYHKEMEMAEIEKLRYMDLVADAINENNVTKLTDERSLAIGAEIYKFNCLVCHGVYGEGTVGPNLTDDYWIHGGGIRNVFRVVKNGVPAKGMIPWKTQLRPVEMQQVSSYILTLAGTDPPNPKAPEGSIWEPDEDKDLSTGN